MLDLPNLSDQAATRPVKTLRVALDASCCPTLRQVFLDNSAFFTEVAPADADVVIFGTDEIAEIGRSELFRRFKAKSICITESDTPTFRLPGIYAANENSVLTADRTRTINYFISERARPNPEIKALIGRNFEKRYLYSFMGGTNSWARRWVFRYTPTKPDTIIEPTDRYNHWTILDAADAAERARTMQRRYAEVMAESKFVLCPRGGGLSSYRLFESMSLGVAPVIISDKWRPIEGIDWSFAIFLREREIPQLDRIIRSHEPEWQARGATARSTYETFFAGDAIAKTLHGQIVDLLPRYSPGREMLIGNAAILRAGYRRSYWAAYAVMKKLILNAYKLSGKSLPFRVYQPAEDQAGRSVKNP